MGGVRTDALARSKAGETVEELHGLFAWITRLELGSCVDVLMCKRREF
jgi:hypothetical protein